MKKIILLTVAMAMFIALPLSSALAVEVFSAETETRIYDPEKSYGGYVMPTQSKGPQTVYLLDMMGNVVHKWDNVGGSPKLLPDGILGSMCQLMDWDGNVLWSYDPMTDSQRDLGPNHDGRFIWNTKLNQYTFLVKTTAPVTEEEIVAAGGDPNWD